ncbi:MAG: hypothetical protein V1944_01970 [Candidatus Aenigmatarchaeota archaeon]
MKTWIYVSIVVLLSIVIGICLVNYLKGNISWFQLTNKNYCSNDNECVWRITNCCPENVGAEWDCSSTTVMQGMIACPQTVICPQVISTKPNQTCGCVNGACKGQ